MPVWNYSDGRAGTTGVYVKASDDVFTGAAKLGAVPTTSLSQAELWRVPGISGSTPTPFDVFPGSPTITDDLKIAFKGNFAEDGIAKTGVFYRKLIDTTYGGEPTPSS